MITAENRSGFHGSTHSFFRHTTKKLVSKYKKGGLRAAVFFGWPYRPPLRFAIGGMQQMKVCKGMLNIFATNAGSVMRFFFLTVWGLFFLKASFGQVERMATTFPAAEYPAGPFLQTRTTDSLYLLLDTILNGRFDAAYLYGYSMPGNELSDSALLLLEKTGLPQGYKSMAMKNELGRIYLEKGDLRKADSLLKEAVSENRRISRHIRNPEMVMSYYYQSRLLMTGGRINEAIARINLALEAGHFGFSCKNLTDLPEDVLENVSPQAYFRCLRLKATLLYEKYLTEKQVPLLKRSVEAFEKAVELNRFILRNIDDQNAKRFYAQQSKQLYNEALPIVYEASLLEKKYLSSALFMLESYKGSELAQALREAHIHHTNKVPVALLREEKKLQQLLQQYYNRIHSSNQPGIVKLSSHHAGYLQEQLSRVRTLIDKQIGSENLYAADIEKKNLLNRMQQGMDDETLMIHYYSGVNNLFLFYLSNSEKGFVKIALTNELQKDIDRFLGKMNRLSDGEPFRDFTLSRKLYDLLIKPAEKTVRTYERWVIVPDDKLFMIPFETLCAEPDGKHMLIHSRDIIYHYAFRLLFNEQNKWNGFLRKDSVLSYAPFAFPLGTGLGIRPLPYSQEEVFFPQAKRILRQKAVKDHFLRQYSAYRYLHFATHATPSGHSGSSRIMFYPDAGDTAAGKLNMEEIYHLNMRGTRLVSLSACETGNGALMKGEGPVSFARAFLYAGADGVVSTLYKTDDLVTAYIMNKMYGYVLNGWDVSKALRQAKIDLLQDGSIDPKLKHPNYWATFVYTGMYENKVTLKASAFFWMLLFMMPFVWLGVSVLRKKSS